ncbi:tubulin-specific chaperone cofactor E-like protein isoform X2 [Amphiura filiformis]|uniref:tubulin-specific chaperone cofactor E-like protein isoform X2 n=1 Tax=Amphiura filiformis TaxID=82378 RepID=UPI003B21702A
MAEAITRTCSTQYDQSVLKALESKYLDTDHNEDYIKTAGIQIMHNLTSIKAGGITLPQCLALNYCHISKAGDAGRLHELCRRVRELDIAENDLKDWNEVVNIINQIPHLEFLNLSSNPLNCKMDLHPRPTTQFTSLKRLALNNTKVPWETTYDLLDIMPGVEELHLSLNDYRNIPSTPNNKTYPQLHMLQFNENHISQWEQLCPLGRAFPQLTSLILIGNKICGKITPEVTANFPKLCCLNLTNTCMQSWEELETLNNFPALVDVRLQGIPFCENMQEKERRQLCIARLGNVTRLNGSQVKDTEREDAERAFIRYYMDSATKPERYRLLIGRYGHIDRLAEVSFRPPDSVKCKVHFENHTKELSVNVKQTCKEFKKSFTEFTGLRSNQYRIYYKDFGGHMIMLRFPDKLLYTFNLKDGAEFVLERKYF